MEEQAFSELVINLISWIESLHEKNLKYEAQVESLTLDLAKARKTNEELEARLAANNIVVAVASGDPVEHATISTLTTSPTTAAASQLTTNTTTTASGADLMPHSSSSSQHVHHVHQQQHQQHLQLVPPIQHQHIQATQHQQAIQHHHQQQQQQPTQQAPIYQQLHNPQHAFVHQPQYVWTTYDGVNGHQVPSYYEYTIPSAPIAPTASTTAFQQQ